MSLLPKIYFYQNLSLLLLKKCRTFTKIIHILQTDNFGSHLGTRQGRIEKETSTSSLSKNEKKSSTSHKKSSKLVWSTNKFYFIMLRVHMLIQRQRQVGLWAELYFNFFCCRCCCCCCWLIYLNIYIILRLSRYCICF